MGAYLMSVCRELSLMDIRDIDAYINFISRASIESDKEPELINHIPGSLKVASESKDEIIAKKITYECMNAGSQVIEALESLKCRKHIAIYKDEIGNLRVCGSPMYPLQLEYEISGGVIMVTLTGESEFNDPILEK